MPVHRHELLDTLPHPLAMVSLAGDILEANLAFREIAQHCGDRATLESLFGVEIRPHLLNAIQSRQAQSSLAVIAGPEPRPWFHVTLARDPQSDGCLVLLVDVSEEVELSRRQRERDREILTLRDIGTVLSGSLELEEITERVCEQVGTLARTNSFFVALYDRVNQTVSFPRYLEDGIWRERTSRPFSNGLTEYVLRTGQPLLLNHDVTQQARELGIEPMGRMACAFLGVPMMASGEVLGVIATQNYVRSECYDRHDVEILSIIAGQAAAAVKNASLLTEARRAYLELSQAQARLLESERIRGITEAVGSMNHEINNPLAAIVGNAQLLLRRKDTLSNDVVAKLESMIESARRIQEVTTKMSTLIQATSTPYPGETTIIDLRRSVAAGEASLFPPAIDPTRRRAA